MSDNTLTPEQQQRWAIDEIMRAWYELGEEDVPEMTGRMAQAIAHLVVAEEAAAVAEAVDAVQS